MTNTADTLRIGTFSVQPLRASDLLTLLNERVAHHTSAALFFIANHSFHHE